jgi:hypothetical protein
MAFNINDIRSQLTYGGARQNLFQVNIQNLGNGSADFKVPFMVQAAQLPASTITPINVPYFGRQLKLAGDRTFEPWTVNIINDEDFLIRNAMEEWSNKINRLQRNIREINKYKSQAQVTQFGKDGSKLRIYEFNGIFPTSISAIDLGWDQDNAYETFQVTFEYDYWTVAGGVTGNAGGS